jgi:hypothetical protein
VLAKEVEAEMEDEDERQENAEALHLLRYIQEIQTMLDEGNNIMYGHYRLRRLLEGTTTLADLEGDRDEDSSSSGGGDDDDDSMQLHDDDTTTLRDALNNVKCIIDQHIQGLNRAAKQALDTEKGGDTRTLSTNTKKFLTEEKNKEEITSKFEEMSSSSAFHDLDTDNDKYLRAAAAVAREKCGVDHKIFQQLQHYCNVRDRCHEDTILHEKLRDHVRKFQNKESPYDTLKAHKGSLIPTPASAQLSMRDTLQNLVTELQVRICDLLRKSSDTSSSESAGSESDTEEQINEGRDLLHLAQSWLARDEGEINNFLVAGELREESLIREKQVYERQAKRLKEISALLQNAEELLTEFGVDMVPADDNGEQEMEED